MTTPRIEVDLNRIRQNAQTLVRRLKPRGIGMTGVTKAVCGHPAIAQAMLAGGADGLAEARLRNVRRLRNAGITCPVTLIRTPMLSQVDEVVRFCEASYNTEMAVVAALAAAAIRQRKVHGVILMVEMGDQREGIDPRDLGTIAQQVVAMPGVALRGIGANFACLNRVVPDTAGMVALSALATDTEIRCGRNLRTVSGGNSANLPWALGAHAARPAGRINDLRLGEAVLLGVDPVTGDQIGGMYRDAFTLVAEVIETDPSAALPNATWADPAWQRLHRVRNGKTATRVILAIGHQDTDIHGLSMPAGATLIGATSDHLVVRTENSTLRVGSEMRFQMNYSALMRAMAAPDIGITLLGDRRAQPARHDPPPSKRLALV